jgi:hypothetical protein
MECEAISRGFGIQLSAEVRYLRDAARRGNSPILDRKIRAPVDASGLAALFF